MRRLKFLGLVIILILSFSCVTEADMWERTYQIKNSTGFDITIRAFENFDGTGLFEDVDLSNNEIYTGVKASGSNFNYLNNPENDIPTISFSYTRFIIVFSNSRKTTHSFDVEDNNVIFSEPTDRNLFRGGNYIDIGNDNYEFVLTQEDYDNAIPCDGDCLD
ncbi:hypothetical protein OAE03_02575 [Winogradskyella sp.]|nr:hypothetical protein [Winogradskyella sp.]MDC0009421.1 hypothetical protein [Winogradskyella sp.]